MQFRKILPAVLFLAAGLILASCGSGDKAESGEDKKVEIVFLTMQLRPFFDEYFHERFAEFEKTHPEAKIVWQDLPYQNYATKLLTSFMGGRAPDVINLASESIPDYIVPGYLLDLDPLVSKEVKDTYVPSLLDACRVKGQLYGLPWYASTAVTFVNTDLMKQAGLDGEIPRYYDDLPELCRTIREKTGKFAIFPVYAEAGALRLFLNDAGIPILNADNTKAAFNTPKGVAILKFWTDLYRENLVPSEALTATHRRPIELYNTGQLAILLNGPQFLRQVKSDAPEVFKATDVGMAMRWKDYDHYSVVLHTIAVAAGSKHPKLASEFAEFITNGESQLAFAKWTPVLPSVQSALEDPYYNQPEDTLEGRSRMFTARAAKGAGVSPMFPEQRRIFRVLDEVTEATALGKMSAQEAMTKAEADVNDILAKKK